MSRSMRLLVRVMGRPQKIFCVLGFHRMVEEPEGWRGRCGRCGTIRQDTPIGYFYEHPEGKWWFSIMADMWW